MDSRALGVALEGIDITGSFSLLSLGGPIGESVNQIDDDLVDDVREDIDFDSETLVELITFEPATAVDGADDTIELGT
ncbi:MAG: hypothetical protein GWO24_06050, partial [Akkermansiaceae bacterium]|nr:hypothetical protein [Akkermansiaceae bacterium]